MSIRWPRERIDGRVRLFAGTEPAHLFVSDDLGVNWSEMPSLRSVPSVPKWNFPAPPHIGHVKHINFDPDNPNTIYASIEVGGLLRSTDGGEHWEEFPDLYEDVHRLMIHPTQREISLCALPAADSTPAQMPATSWEQWTRREDEIGGYPGRLCVPSVGSEIDLHDRGARRSRHVAHDPFCRRAHLAQQRRRPQLGDFAQRPARPLASEHRSVLFGGSGRFDGDLRRDHCRAKYICSNDLGDSWQMIVNGLPPISKAGHFNSCGVTGYKRVREQSPDAANFDSRIS